MEREQTRETEVPVESELSPFAVPPVEGIPFERGSEEDQAIQAVIDEAERARLKPSQKG